MIIEHHHNKYCDEDVVYIWIDEALPPDFERRLLMELLALAGPRWFGSTEAPSIDAVIDEGLRNAVQKHSFHRGYWFDYVNGYRLKVEYLPCGYASSRTAPTFGSAIPACLWSCHQSMAAMRLQG